MFWFIYKSEFLKLLIQRQTQIHTYTFTTTYCELLLRSIISTVSGSSWNKIYHFHGNICYVKTTKILKELKKIMNSFFWYVQIFEITCSEKIDLLQLDMVNAKTADVEERLRSDFSMKQADSPDSDCECWENNHLYVEF